MYESQGEAACKDLKETDLGGAAAHDDLDGHDTARKHGKTARTADVVHTQDTENLIRQYPHVYVGKVKRTILFHYDIDVLIESCMVNAPLDNAKCEDGCLHFKGVVRGECPDRPPQCRAVTVAEAPHHTEVNPDDVSAADADVAGMRITVEKTVLNDLLGVVLTEPSPNLRDVDPCRPEGIRLIEGNAVDVLHDENMLGGEITQYVRAGDKRIITIEVCELLNVTCLDEEVHLLFCNVPHLIHQRAKVNDIVAADKADEGGGAFHQSEIGAHDLVDAGTLYLDHNLLTRGKCGTVRLCDAGRAEGCTVDRAENFVPLAVILLLDDGKDDGEGEGPRCRLQLHQLVAVVRRKKIRAHAHDLPKLDEGGAEILEDGAQFRGGEAMDDVVAAQYRHHFAQTQCGVFVFGAVQQCPQHDLTSRQN